MHAEKNSGRQLGPHNIHTWAIDRHWQNKNAWLIAERTRAKGEAVSCQTGVREGLDVESRACRECEDAEGRKPRTDEEGEVWRSSGSVQERSRRCSAATRC